MCVTAGGLEPEHMLYGSSSGIAAYVYAESTAVRHLDF
jgi:hypothetical protein